MLQVKLGEWRIIFFVAAAFYFFGNLIFVIFGEASIQQWNEPNEDNTNSTDMDEGKLGKFLYLIKIKSLNMIRPQQQKQCYKFLRRKIFLYYFFE